MERFEGGQTSSQDEAKQFIAKNQEVRTMLNHVDELL